MQKRMSDRVADDILTMIVIEKRYLPGWCCFWNGFETSGGFISDVTDKILPQIEDWQNRPLDEVYPILYIDAIHYSVRDNGVIRKLAAYVILGINAEGRKEVMTISVGDNESAKYWLSVLNELKKPWSKGHFSHLRGRPQWD